MMSRMRCPLLVWFLLLGMAILKVGCKRSDTQTQRGKQTEDGVLRIAFGSCNTVERPQHLWDDIVSMHPDIWIWLGDNIYADTDDPQVMREKYERVRSHPHYSALRARASIYGTWDDHDYGKNDAGKEWHAKEVAKAELLRFLEVPKSHPVWHRPGVYQHYFIQREGVNIDLILLDTRYFRDSIGREAGVYMPNDTGTLLGAAQWKWLDSVVHHLRGDIVVLVSSIQLIPEQHRFEKWANFPHERQRILQMLDSLNKPVIVLSGDRHFGELSRWSPRIYELTSSSLNKSFGRPRNEPNRYRVGKPIVEDNYGLVQIVPTGEGFDIDLKLLGVNNRLFLATRWRWQK